MKCPNCGVKADRKDTMCRNCGTVLKKEKKGFLPALGTKKNDNVLRLEDKSAAKSSALKGKYLKPAIMIAGAAVVLLLIVMLIFHIASGKGLKQAEKLSGYIGARVTSAEKDLEINMNDSSSFSSVNKTDEFDFIYESEDDVEVNDVSFPEWTVGILKTESEKIDKVVFTDYRVLKKDTRGVKTDRRVDLSKYDSSSKMSAVLDDIDFDPFRITYDVAYIKYEFRYYYKMDNGDIQAVVLTVVANIDNKFMYSVSEDIPPVYIYEKKLDQSVNK